MVVLRVGSVMMETRISFIAYKVYSDCSDFEENLKKYLSILLEHFHFNHDKILNCHQLIVVYLRG